MQYINEVMNTEKTTTINENSLIYSIQSKLHLEHKRFFALQKIQSLVNYAEKLTNNSLNDENFDSIYDSILNILELSPKTVQDSSVSDRIDRIEEPLNVTPEPILNEIKDTFSNRVEALEKVNESVSDYVNDSLEKEKLLIEQTRQRLINKVNDSQIILSESFGNLAELKEENEYLYGALFQVCKQIETIEKTKKVLTFSLIGVFFLMLFGIPLMIKLNIKNYQNYLNKECNNVHYLSRKFCK